MTYLTVRRHQVAVVVAIVAGYLVMSVWLASFGPTVTSTLLTLQIVTYSLAAALGVGLLVLFQFPMPWATRRSNRLPIIIVVAVAVAAIVVRFLVKHPPTGWAGGSSQGWRDIADSYLVGRLLVPIAEEVTFRGVLFGVLRERARLSATATVLATSVVFAALHWPPLYGLRPDNGLEVASALAAGIAFGSLRAWTGSILPGLGLHMLGNTIGF